MRDILITGTDTGIGKTVIAAAVVKVLRAKGVRALGFKPVETGIDGAEAADSEVLRRASGETAPLAVPLVQLAEPLAPAVAAERAGTPIHAAEIEERVALLRRAGYTLVIEGSGGVMVPLCWEGSGSPFPLDSGRGAPGPLSYTVLDLAERCGLAAIVVARAGLGTLNHVTMTVAMLQSRSIPIRGIVLNNGHPSQSADLAQTTNPDALARMLPDVRVVNVPHHASGDPVDATVSYLMEFVAGF